MASWAEDHHVGGSKMLLLLVVVALGVLDNAVLIDDEGGAFRNPRHAEVQLRQKRVVGDAIFLGDFVFVIAQQRYSDVLFLGPRFLRERIVAADSVNFRVQSGVFAQSVADTAHFLGAGSGERHREKKQERIFLAEVIAELDLLWAGGGFCR